MGQNYPNPFNPTTSISYRLKRTADVKLTIYNIKGQPVETLVNQKQSAGRHEVTFNAKNHPSGLYLYHLEAGPYSQTRKMLLVK